jgi:hypothetical protein
VIVYRLWGGGGCRYGFFMWQLSDMPPLDTGGPDTSGDAGAEATATTMAPNPAAEKKLA